MEMLKSTDVDTHEPEVRRQRALTRIANKTRTAFTKRRAPAGISLSLSLLLSLSLSLSLSLCDKPIWFPRQLDSGNASEYRILTVWSS